MKNGRDMYSLFKDRQKMLKKILDLHSVTPKNQIVARSKENGRLRYSKRQKNRTDLPFMPCFEGNLILQKCI